MDMLSFQWAKNWVASLVMGGFLFVSVGSALAQQTVPVPEKPPAAKPAGPTKRPQRPAGPPAQQKRKPADQSKRPGSKATPQPVTKKPATSADKKVEEKQPKRSDGKVELNFRNVELVNFISTMAKALNIAFLWDDKEIRGKITLVSPKRFSKPDAYKIFETVLALHGYTTIKNSDTPIIQIVPMKDASRIPSTTLSGTVMKNSGNVLVTQIIPLQFADANQVKVAITPIISKSAVLGVYQQANVLLITDTEANIKRLLTIVKELDTAPGDSEYRVYQLKYAVARKLAPILTSVVSAGGTGTSPTPTRTRRNTPPAAGGAGGGAKVIAVEHTNAIIVVGDAYDQDQMGRLIETLDVPADQVDSGIRVYRLEHADAEELQKILMDVKKVAGQQGGQPPRGAAQSRLPDVVIAADKPTNSLVVFGGAETIEAMDLLVKQLDVRRLQVFVEALIMELTLEKSLQLGINWQGTNLSGDTGTGVGFPGSMPQTLPQVLGRGAGAVVGVVGNEIEFQGQKFASFSAFIQATRQDQDLNILANPQILTLNNEEAEINVSQVVPISAKILRDANQNTTTEFEFKDVGIILKITPQITGGDKVRLIIDQESSSVASRQDSLGTDQSAITTLKRSLKTKVLVDNNSTIAIGGLIQDQQVQNETKVPCLGDIPVLGWFFKSRSEELRKTNMIVFIRPRVITTRDQSEVLSGSLRRRFRDASRLGAHVEQILTREFLKNKAEEEAERAEKEKEGNQPEKAEQGSE